MKSVLVGFDGSADAIAAARWAAREARLRHAPLRIVHTYDYPYLERLDHDAQEALAGEEAAIADLGRQVAADGAPDVGIEVSVAVGQPATELIAAAADADLLVLGRRGRKPVHRLLLGSVANKCLHAVACPVVIVADPGAPPD